MSTAALEPDRQAQASDPEASVFVTANAGAGKTTTLVSRVARLLLRGVDPDALLCVTYTKAAAAEMQRRLFDRLGGWAVMPDAELAARLEALEPRAGGYDAGDLSRARALFARALETPGGLKIQTIHAFCEKLLKRFPLEAGVSPGFKVLDDAAAAEVSAGARDQVALRALRGDGVIADAYAHFAVALDAKSFNEMFAGFAIDREAIADYLARCGGLDGAEAEIWERCGFDGIEEPEVIEAAAVAATDWDALRRAVAALGQGSLKSDAPLGQRLAALAERPATVNFADLWSAFCTEAGAPRAKMATNAVDQTARDWLAREQERLGEACRTAKAAKVARDTVFALSLAQAYAVAYGLEKTWRGALDFTDLIVRTKALLTENEQAAWVLYKLDGGVDHVLLDEAQDTAPEQWEIVRAITEEFFSGGGLAPRGPLERTLFAVGDEKQSIYSFQGARPERFVEEGRAYTRLVADAGRRFEGPVLEHSWRSVLQVLTFVDAVFSPPEAAQALSPLRGEIARHLPKREGQTGSIELWPLTREEKREERDAWEAPLDAVSPKNARRELADRIALEIKGLIGRGEVVWDKHDGDWDMRPAGFGDVLILVRRRDALFEEILRSLKRHGVPVAGADRLKLSDHIVFDDVMGLVRFVLFPSDDLTLAALLRSPFVTLDEDSLFHLARAREGTLWGALQRRALERPAWAQAMAFFAWAIEAAERCPPFEFLGRVLNHLDAEGRSVRERFLARLGAEAEDALDEMLTQALGAERRGEVDLERFAAAMAEIGIEVKRELDEPNGLVRVMTVHGAKGLEAPIVILPDTTTKPPNRGSALLKTEDGGFLWCASKKDDCGPSGEARSLRDRKTQEENLRLFYVALTRARDRLIIAGRLASNRTKPDGGGWYALAEAAFAHETVAPDTRQVTVGEATLIRFGPDPVVVVGAAPAAPATGPLPEWVRRAVPAEPGARYASPSSFGQARAAAPSPLAQRSGLGQFRRGDLIHKLLELLPDLASADRPPAARRYLERQPDLSDDHRAEMAAAAIAVLSDDRFAAVFGPGSRSEAAVAGSAPGLAVPISGRVDRLLVEPERVLVVDFKSNRPSPDRIEDADPTYLRQMAVYVAVLREVFPGRRVEAALLWTEGPKLMSVPDALIERALAEIAVG